MQSKSGKLHGGFAQRLYPDSDFTRKEITTFPDPFTFLQREGSLDRRRILSRKDL